MRQARSYLLPASRPFLSSGSLPSDCNEILCIWKSSSYWILTSLGFQGFFFKNSRLKCMEFPGGSLIKNLPANAGDLGSIPGLGRSPGGGNGNPLQYSCLENSIDRGTWRAIVCGVAKLDMTEHVRTLKCKHSRKESSLPCWQLILYHHQSESL